MEFNIKDKFGFGDITSFGEATSKLLTPIFSIATVLVVLYFLFGGFKFLQSAGNKEEVESAKHMITHAIYGFIILIFAFFILEFLPQFFGFNLSLF